MSDEARTRDRHITELNEMRQRVGELESLLRQSERDRLALRDSCDHLLQQASENSAQSKTQSEMLQSAIDKSIEIENELDQQERIYRTLVETAKDVIWTVDLSLRYTYVSPSVNKGLGYTVEEIMAMRPLDGLTPESRERVIKAFREELELEASGPREKYTSRTEEIERYCKDGTTRWEEITTTFLRDSGGKPIGILGISHDVTERKQMEDALRQARDELEYRVEQRTDELLKANAQLQKEVWDRKKAEEALRESEQRLELALNGADFGLWDWYVQTDYAVINKRSAEIVGYELDEIEQRFSFWEILLHPEDRVRAVEAVYAHFEGRTDYYEDEYRVKTKSGEWKWIFSRGKVVERDPEGKPLRMAGTYQDITSRKQTEEALRQSEERYGTVADFTYDWEYWIDLSGNFLYVSPSCERITGYAANEFLDDPGLFNRIVHPDDVALVTTHWQEARKAEPTKTYCFDFRIIHSDGGVRWINHACQPVYGEGGRPLGRRACNRDITDRKIAENELLESQRLLKSILAAVPVGIGLHRNRHIQWANEAWEKMFGFTGQHEYMGQSTRMRYQSDVEYDLAGRELYEGLEAGAVREIDTKLKRHDGSVFAGVVRVTALEPSDLTKGVIAAITDVSERKRAEEALRESEEKYRASFNNAAVGIDLVDCDGRILQVNETLSKFLGYTQEELRNLTILDVTHPEDVDRTKERYDALIQGETESYRLQKRYVRKDGATVWADTSVSVIRSQAGQYLATVGVILDITQRRRSEQIRRRLATAVEQAAETIEITDTEGTIEYVNPAFERTTGYSRKEAIGKNPRVLKSGQHDDRFYKNMWETIIAGRVWSGHLVNRKKDGTLFEEEVTISPIRDRAGKIINYVAVKRDVTREMSLQAQLLHAQKMEAIGTLAGGIAHDFNNLLQVTLGYSELLLQEKQPEDPEYKDLQKIFHAAKSGAELVQRMLTFSRKVEPKTIPLNLNRQIVQVEKLLRRTIPKMIDIQMDLSGDLAEVSADPTQMEQVLMNLAVNARDAMPDGGRFILSTKNVTVDGEYCKVHRGIEPGEYVLLTVSDTGHGMDKTTLEHIFEPFYTTKELGRGTGLGLAVVYGIVKQHEGFINCYSEVEHGTAFNVYLPAIERQVEPEVDKTGVMPAFGTETILLVDDEEFVRDLGARILSKAGYKVLTATNGREALDLFEKERTQISLVILDLIMPEMGGKECHNELLKIDPHVKVLIASGYSDASMKESLDAGAKAFVDKPFRVKELLRQVRTVLDAS